MRRMTYAEAAAGAASSSDLLQQQQLQPHKQQQLSTGTSPSLCSGASSQEDGEDRKQTDVASRHPIASATASSPVAPMGANPGTVKLLREQFERQSSDFCLPTPSRSRLPTRVPASAATPEGSSISDDLKHWELLTDAQACAEVIQHLLQEKQQLQQQVESLWNQKEAFRCANERIAKVFLRQQQQQPAAAELVAAAEAAGATPRKDLSRRCVTVVPSGCLTARGPRGPRMSKGTPTGLLETEPLDFSAIKLQQQQQLPLQHPKQQQQQQQKKNCAIPGLAPLNLGILGRPAGCNLSGFQGDLCVHAPLTCRSSLASSALKTPRRRFDDGGISARAAKEGRQRLGPEEAQQHLQHVAVEEALFASMRSMNMLGFGSSSGGTSARAAAKFESTPEAALMRCSSNPEKGYWHTTFLCVLKVEGTDFFLDAQQRQYPSVSRRSGSNFFFNNTADDAARGDTMNGARVVASKETAGVFLVCVRHLLHPNYWIRSVFTSMLYGLPSGVDTSLLPPDQTLNHGLSIVETQAGALGGLSLSSSPSDSGREEESAAAATDGTNSSNWSGWDAVAFRYQKSIDALGAAVPGKAANPPETLYISTNILDGGDSWLPPSGSNSNSSSKSNKDSSSSSSNAETRRAEPFSAANQLLLQNVQAAEQLFIVRAKDRLAGVMPLFHHVSQKYLHIHPTMGLVGLVPPVIEQEKQLRLQQKGKQQKKKTKKRLKAKKQVEGQQQLSPQDVEASTNVSNAGVNSPETGGEPISPDLFLRPCRIELIPLADLLLQQSVQRVISSVQEASLQQLRKVLEEDTPEGPRPVAVAAAGISNASSDSSSDEADSFDGVVASEGFGDGEPNKGNSSSSLRPLVPPLGIGAAAATPEGSLHVSRQPVLLEFKLDDEGVETDVEEGAVARRSSSSTHVDIQFNCPASIEPAPQ